MLGFYARGEYSVGQYPAAIVLESSPITVTAIWAKLLVLEAAIATLPATIWDEVLTKVTHNIANSAGKIVRQLKGAAVHDGTAQTAGVNTITMEATASAVDNIYKEGLIVIVDGTAAGEAHHILSYNGTTKIAVVDQSWFSVPDSTSEYIIYGGSAHDISESGIAAAGASSSITFNGSAATTDDIYTDQMVFISSGTGTGQVRRITDYVGATKVATVDKAWVITPDSTSGYMLYPAVDNALAVLTAATTTPIAANMEQTNAVNLKGDGTAGDKFRSTLVA